MIELRAGARQRGKPGIGGKVPLAGDDTDGGDTAGRRLAGAQPEPLELALLVHQSLFPHPGGDLGIGMIAERLAQLVQGAALPLEPDGFAKCLGRTTAVAAGAALVAGRWRRRNQADQRVDGLLAEQCDAGGRSPPVLAGDGEEARRGIELDAGAVSGARKPGDPALQAPAAGLEPVEQRPHCRRPETEEHLDAGLGGADLGIARDRLKQLGGPVADPAVVDTAIEIESGEVVIGAKIPQHDPDAAAGTIETASGCVFGLVAPCPGRGIGRVGPALRLPRAIRDLCRLAGAPARFGSPHEPARQIT